MKRLSVDLSDEVHQKLKVHCAIEGLDMAEVARRLIEDYLQKVKVKVETKRNKQ
jgi:ParG